MEFITLGNLYLDRAIQFRESCTNERFVRKDVQEYYLRIYDKAVFFHQLALKANKNHKGRE